MQLSQNFKLEEFYASDIAKLSGINNKPNEEHIVNITRLHDNCMLQIRMNLKMPVIISSGYRCKKLNNKIGGVYNSQHIEGKAVDFTVKGKSNSLPKLSPKTSSKKLFIILIFCFIIYHKEKMLMKKHIICKEII